MGSLADKYDDPAEAYLLKKVLMAGNKTSFS